MQLNSSFMQMSSASLLIEQLRTSVNNTYQIENTGSEHHSAINQRITDEKVIVRMQSGIETCVLAVDYKYFLTQKNLEIALQNNTDTFKNCESVTRRLVDFNESFEIVLQESNECQLNLQRMASIPKRLETSFSTCNATLHQVSFTSEQLSLSSAMIENSLHDCRRTMDFLKIDLEACHDNMGEMRNELNGVRTRRQFDQSLLLKAEMDRNFCISNLTEIRFDLITVNNTSQTELLKSVRMRTRAPHFRTRNQ
jgi:hypothetical protein